MLILFYVLIFLLPFQNHYLVNSTIGPITIIKALGLTVFILALIRALSRRIPRVWGSLPAKALLFFSFWTVISWFFARKNTWGDRGFTEWELYGVTNVISVLMFLFISLVVIDSREKLRRTMMVCVAAMVLAGCYIVRDYLGGDDRPGWPFQDANYYALYALSVLPMALAVLSVEKRKLYRMVYYGAIGLCLVGLLLSASRAGFITLLLFALIQVFRGKHTGQKVWLVGGILVASLFMAPKVIQRIINPSRHDIHSNDAHKQFAKAAYRAMLDHPVVGVGPSAVYFKGYLEETGEEMLGIAHNMFLEIGADSGIPALLAYLVLLGGSWFTLGRRAKDFAKLNEPFLEALAGNLRFSLMNAALMGLTISAGYLRFLWFLYILTILLNDTRFGVVEKTIAARPVALPAEQPSVLAASTSSLPQSLRSASGGRAQTFPSKSQPFVKERYYK